MAQAGRRSRRGFAGPFRDPQRLSDDGRHDVRILDVGERNEHHAVEEAPPQAVATVSASRVLPRPPGQRHQTSVLHESLDVRDLPLTTDESRTAPGSTVTARSSGRSTAVGSAGQGLLDAHQASHGAESVVRLFDRFRAMQRTDCQPDATPVSPRIVLHRPSSV